MSRLYEIGQVEERDYKDDYAYFKVRIPPHCEHDFEPYVVKD